jgi:hypothetical protein
MHGKICVSLSVSIFLILKARVNDALTGFGIRLDFAERERSQRLRK